jgi:hypothetical protein
MIEIFSKMILVIQSCSFIIEIPQWWSKPGTKDEDKQTRTKLMKERK